MLPPAFPPPCGALHLVCAATSGIGAAQSAAAGSPSASVSVGLSWPPFQFPTIAPLVPPIATPAFLPSLTTTTTAAPTPSASAPPTPSRAMAASVPPATAMPGAGTDGGMLFNEQLLAPAPEAGVLVENPYALGLQVCAFGAAQGCMTHCASAWLASTCMLGLACFQVPLPTLMPPCRPPHLLSCKPEASPRRPAPPKAPRPAKVSDGAFIQCFSMMQGSQQRLLFLNPPRRFHTLSRGGQRNERGWAGRRPHGDQRRQHRLHGWHQHRGLRRLSVNRGQLLEMVAR